MGFYVAMKDLGDMNWTNAKNQCSSYVFCGNIKGTFPSKNQLLAVYNNKSAVNQLLYKNGGTQMTDHYWVSGGEYNYHDVVRMYDGDVYNIIGTNDRQVRPILTSY